MRTFVTVSLTVLVVACGRPSIPCTTSSCTGCCDTSGQCVSLATASACGVNGSACVQCQASQSCQFGACVGGFGTGGGFAGVGGGSTGTGGGSAGVGGGSTGTGGGLAGVGGGSTGTSGGSAGVGGGSTGTGGGAATGGGLATGGGVATDGGSSTPAPDVLLLVDVSGSMNSPLISSGPTCNTCSGASCPSTCPTRERALRGALASFLQSSSGRVRLGLTTFPSRQPFTPVGCAPPTSETVALLPQSTPDTPVALVMQSMAVQTAVSGIGSTIAVTGGTPTAGALRFAATLAPLRNPSGRTRGVVLVTDGLPNCNPTNQVSCVNMPLPSSDLCTLGANCLGQYCAAGYLDQVATVQAVAALRALGVRTAVVVISEVLTPQVTTVMNAMADEGGAPVCSASSPACTQRFSFANDEAALTAALGSALQRVSGP